MISKDLNEKRIIEIILCYKEMWSSQNLINEQMNIYFPFFFYQLLYEIQLDLLVLHHNYNNRLYIYRNENQSMYHSKHFIMDWMFSIGMNIISIC